MNAGTFVTVTVVVSNAMHGWVHGGGDTTARKGEGKSASSAQNSPMEDAKRPIVTRGCWK
jgi:hypothetical protein